MPEPALVLPASKASYLPGWPVAVALTSASLMAAGGIIALVRPEMLVASGVEIGPAAHIYAGYLVSRNLVIALLLFVTLALKARRALANFMFLTAMIQFFDLILDYIEGRWTLVPGILILGIALLMAAHRIANQPFWKRDFWSA